MAKAQPKKIYYALQAFTEMVRDKGFEIKVLWERREKSEPHITFPWTGLYIIRRPSDGRWNMAMVQGGRTEEDGFTIFAIAPTPDYEKALHWLIDQSAVRTSIE